VCEERYARRAKWILQRRDGCGGGALGRYIYCTTPVWGGWYSGETREWKKEKDREREDGIKITVSLEGPFITGRKLALTTQFLDKTSSESPCGSGGGRNRAIGYVYSIYT